MPYRPTPQFRRNIKGVIYPLTEAVRRLYGCRPEDGAYPIGAFYPINVSNTAWNHVDGIWYIPALEESLNARNPREEIVLEFMHSIQTGAAVELPSGVEVTWERIPIAESHALPSI
jgi:hypothetical protein